MAESSPNSTLSGRLVRNINSFIIIRLDTNSLISELHRIVNYYPIRTFNHPDDCLVELNDEKIFLVLSTSFSQTFVLRVHILSQLDSIYLISDTKIDVSTSLIPFISLENLRYFSGVDSENEILFSMHSIFPIGKINQINNSLWQINLTATNNNDQQLKNLTEQIRKETWGTNWMASINDQNR
jgi:hypothetical protein